MTAAVNSAIAVPLFAPDLGESEKRALARCIDEGWVAQGPRCAELERAFCTKLGSPYAASLSSCTAALHLAVKLVGAGPGDEVIVPSLTFAATANAVAYCGATPVFADVTSTEDWTINPADIERLISPRTKAIMVMHYGGFPCDMAPILAIARHTGLPIIEDACHGLGGLWDGKAMGTIGTIGCFSFYSNKVMTTGEGGLLVTNSEALHRRCILLRSHGMTAGAYDRIKGAMGYDIVEIGYNYRLDDIRASVGLMQIERLDWSIARRRELVKQYHALLDNVSGVMVPRHGGRGVPAHYIFPVLIDAGLDREAIRAQMLKFGVQTSMHYPPVHRFSHYAKPEGSLPVTEDVARRTITLPLYPRLREDQIALVVRSLSESIAAQRASVN